jgi:hypothetical protein
MHEPAQSAPTISKSKGRLWISLIVIQFIFVIFGAAQLAPSLPILNLPWLEVPLSFYSEFSGASHGYGFFSPGIYSQIRGVIEVTDRKGLKTKHAITAGLNREAELRLNDIVEQFINDFEDPMQFQRSLAASLAGSTFGKNPQAEKVEVRIEQYAPPSRIAYLNGHRSEWETAYSAKFIHPRAEKDLGVKKVGVNQ